MSWKKKMKKEEFFFFPFFFPPLIYFDSLVHFKSPLYIYECSIENNSREFGVAMMDLCAIHTITLTEIRCSASYTQILAFLQAICPKLILYPSSQSSRIAVHKIEKLCQEKLLVEMAPINRSCGLF